MLPNPAAVQALQSRVDVLARKTNGDLWRTASYTGAETWQQPWELLCDAPAEGLPSNPPFSDAGDSGLAAAASGDGRIVHVCALALKSPGILGRGTFHHRRTEDFTNSWTNWSRIGEGVFNSAPAMAASGNGQMVIIVGRGLDDHLWFARSWDAGRSWDIAWSPIGQGTFLDATPAVSLSGDGQRVYVYGMGKDKRVWSAFSTDAGSSWAMAWAPVGQGLFNSGPGSAASADGRRVLLAARGLDNRMYFNRSDDFANSWPETWALIPEGSAFQSAPAVATSWDGQTVHVFAVGGDARVWRAASFDGGTSWATAWAPVGSKTF